MAQWVLPRAGVCDGKVYTGLPGVGCCSTAFVFGPLQDVWHPEVTNDERAGAAAAVGVERELVERLQQVDAMGELVEWRREEAQAGARGRGRGGRAPGEVRV